jgi:hypothetical protein
MREEEGSRDYELTKYMEQGPSREGNNRSVAPQIHSNLWC